MLVCVRDMKRLEKGQQLKNEIEGAGKMDVDQEAGEQIFGDHGILAATDTLHFGPDAKACEEFYKAMGENVKRKVTPKKLPQPEEAAQAGSSLKAFDWATFLPTLCSA